MVDMKLKRGFTDEEKMFIITVVGESGEEDIAAQNAVAHTIMNRVNNPNIWYKPESVTEVISKKKSQYNAWDSPNYPAEWAMEKIENRTGTDEQFEEIVDRLLDIYNGVTPDNTGGATSFYSPGLLSSPPFWAEEMEQVYPSGDYGDFEFYK